MLIIVNKYTSALQPAFSKTACGIFFMGRICIRFMCYNESDYKNAAVRYPSGGRGMQHTGYSRICDFRNGIWDLTFGQKK